MHMLNAPLEHTELFLPEYCIREYQSNLTHHACIICPLIILIIMLAYMTQAYSYSVCKYGKSRLVYIS